MNKDEVIKEGVRLYREFLNMGQRIFDDYYTDEDNLPETNSEGNLRAYKSEELLKWMGDVMQWCKNDVGVNVTKEDHYEQMKAENPSVQTLEDVFGLKIE
jgi:hypothetical protein